LCYRCEACQEIVPPGNIKLRHVIRRGQTVRRLVDGMMESVNLPNSQIEKELAVCRVCKSLLDRGVDLSCLRPSGQPINRPILAESKKIFISPVPVVPCKAKAV
jgi:hypothetical protein